MIRRIKSNIIGITLLHNRFRVSYPYLFKCLLLNEPVTIHVDSLNVAARFRKSLYIAKSLSNIEKYGWSITGTSDNLVRFENKDIKLYSKINDDYPYSSVIYEIFIKEEYKADIKDKVVIDVGAYHGESAIYFALQGAKKVIALEPDEDNYKIALKNIKENGLENKILLINKALASKDDKVNFYKYLHSSIANSTDPENMDKLKDVVITKQVDATTLDNIIGMIEDENIGLLKMDCEGCEYSILNSFNNYEKIENIILEYHNGIQNLFNLLQSHGFQTDIAKINEKIGILRAKKLKNEKTMF